MLVELQGQLERITYKNEENHYMIAKMKVKGQKDLVTIVGNLVSVTPGEVLRLKGSWDRHPKYGEQFKVVSYETSNACDSERDREISRLRPYKGHRPCDGKEARQ